MKKILFIDRDGTIIKEPEDEQIDSLEKMDLLPGVITNLAKIYQELDFEFVMVTNQDGLGTESFPEHTFWPVQNHLIKLLESEGIFFDNILIDRSFPEEQLPTRKPGTGMLNSYIHGKYDLASSFVIGDRLSDIQLSRNLGCGSIFITSSGEDVEVDCRAGNWNEIYRFLRNIDRQAVIRRATKETSIVVDLNLDGEGKSDINTGLGFFDHMLEQLSVHGGMDIRIEVDGDLYVDEHHVIEDVGLSLGDAFTKALGTKKGISRYGFMLPMDDCLARVAVDFGGRPWLVWNAEFNRERIGEVPTEMFFHFFKSFTDNARCNLNIEAEGQNEHHKIESIFKCFARAVRMAVKRSDSSMLPSSKGIL